MRPQGRLGTRGRRLARRCHRCGCAGFDREVTLDAAEIAPIVTWGTSPEDALPITATIPDPARMPGRAPSARARSAGLHGAGRPGGALTDVRWIRCSSAPAPMPGSRTCAPPPPFWRGARAKVPGIVSPGSRQVKAQAEAEGLDRMFIEAGLDWVGAGCSMCVGMNGDLVAPGKRCASTTNRNFRGRQGPGARTHLMSPAMVAAAAVTGTIADVRPLLQGRAV